MRLCTWTCIRTLASASLLAIAGTSFAGSSNCCIPNGGQGCDDAACQAAICGADPFCCTNQWDQICADAAAIACDVCNGGGGGSNCCVPNGGQGCDDATCEAAVCGADPFCCTNQWDQICADAAAIACDVCNGGGSCPPSSNDCCAAGTGPGCNNADCCNAVCAADPFCCENTWDTQCAGEAGDLCGDLCAGGACPPSSNDCCAAGTGPGCNNVDCCNVVCAADAFCCENTWDAICAASAAELCGDLCPAGPSNCCVANGGAGCDNDACETTVCAVDPFCCNNSWDTLCADEAAELCGDLCGGGIACPTDLNGDGQTDAADLAILLGQWGGAGSADFDGNGNVGAPDLAILLGAWGPCP